MGNSAGNADKKATKTGQNDKTKRKTQEQVGRKRKKQHNKNYDTTWGNKLESTGERIKIKEISTKGKTIQIKLDIL